MVMEYYPTLPYFNQDMARFMRQYPSIKRDRLIFYFAHNPIKSNSKAGVIRAPIFSTNHDSLTNTFINFH
jgi:hypothetical protein